MFNLNLHACLTKETLGLGYIETGKLSLCRPLRRKHDGFVLRLNHMDSRHECKEANQNSFY